MATASHAAEPSQVASSRSLGRARISATGEVASDGIRSRLCSEANKAVRPRTSPCETAEASLLHFPGPASGERFGPSGMASRGIHQNGTNRILSLASPADRRRLEAESETVSLDTREHVYQPNERIKFLYFPLTTVISLVLENGDKPVEVATVGNEGVAGVPVFLSGDRSSAHAFAQIPGEAHRIGANAFRRVLDRSRGFRVVLERYTLALIGQISQTVACNLLHAAGQRMCRWLLILQDRVGTSEFPRTHEFLAQMLGVRRATVTIVAGLLQREGLITYRLGRIQILDRRRLEQESCACYRIVRKEQERLLN